MGCCHPCTTQQEVDGWLQSSPWQLIHAGWPKRIPEWVRDRIIHSFSTEPYADWKELYDSETLERQVAVYCRYLEPAMLERWDSRHTQLLHRDMILQAVRTRLNTKVVKTPIPMIKSLSLSDRTETTELTSIDDPWVQTIVQFPQTVHLPLRNVSLVVKLFLRAVFAPLDHSWESNVFGDAKVSSQEWEQCLLGLATYQHFTTLGRFAACQTPQVSNETKHELFQLLIRPQCFQPDLLKSLRSCLPSARECTLPSENDVRIPFTLSRYVWFADNGYIIPLSWISRVATYSTGNERETAMIQLIQTDSSRLWSFAVRKDLIQLAIHREDVSLLQWVLTKAGGMDAVDSPFLLQSLINDRPNRSTLIEILNLYYRLGVDLNTRLGLHKTTIMIELANKYDWTGEIATLHNLGVDWNHQEVKYGHTFLIKAIQHRREYKDWIEDVLECGYNPNIRDFSGLSYIDHEYNRFYHAVSERFSHIHRRGIDYPFRVRNPPTRLTANNLSSEPVQDVLGSSKQAPVSSSG